MRRRPGFTLIECCVAVWLLGVALLALAGALTAAHRSQRRVADQTAQRAVESDAREHRVGAGCLPACGMNGTPPTPTPTPTPGQEAPP